MSRSTVGGALAVLLGLLSVVVLRPDPAGADIDPDAPVERVVIVSLPDLTWAETGGGDTPVLDRFVERAAVGVLTSQVDRGPAGPTSAYLTIGAGTRAVAPSDPAVDGSLAVDEAGGIAYPALDAAVAANEDSLYGGVPGTLGEELDQAGVDRAVVANADADEGFTASAPEDAYARSAATVLMDRDGLVPGGTVGRDLLVDDAEAPFGRRLDPGRVLAAVDEAWPTDGPGVVLVEASDLARAAAYAARATPGQAAALRREALRAADDLLGEVLDRVDPRTDAVLVLSASAPGGLGTVALQAPDVEPGLLRSATTRRAGYVVLADVTPTVLALAGVEPPTDIEGRAFSVEGTGGDRVGRLVDQGVAAEARDDRLPVVVTVVIVALVVLVGLVTWRHHLPARVRPVLLPSAVAMLGLVPGTYLAGHLQEGRQGFGLYAVGVVAVALVVGLAGTLAERRWRGSGVLVGLGAVLLFFTADVVAGAPFQVNTVFGYSTAVAGRFAGLGNLAFALFSAAALTLAVTVADRGGPRAPLVAGALMVAAVLVDGLPMLGADVGGVASMVPALALTALVLSGRTVRWPHLVGCVVASFVAVVGFGLLDASRPAGSQTHLARLGEHVVDGRLDAVGDTLLRRIENSFGSTTTFAAALLVGVAGLVGARAVIRSRGWGQLARFRPRDATGRALGTGLGVLAAVGLVVNDSSIAVPTTMLIVIVPVLVLRHLDGPLPPEPTP